MITLDARGEIVDAVAFLNPDLFAYFGWTKIAWTSD